MSASTAVEAPLEQTDNRRWIALAVIVLAQFMVVLDVAIVNVALPSIKTDLNFSEQNLQWVITAYSILFGGVLLLGGRLADILGRRKLFIAGIALFTVSSLLDGLAWSEGSLIAFRALQGLGAALVSPLGLDREKVNVNGGAIALGHPLGATGTRLVITLLNELRRRKKKYGLATACIGGGQGIAMVVENFN